VIALVVTLVALSSERSPLKRSFLKLCAGISAAAIVIPLVILIVVSSGGGGGTDTNGPCVGGPDVAATGTPTSNGDVIFPCAISGSTKVHLGNGP
jgi:hypothetical protein